MPAPFDWDDVVRFARDDWDPVVLLKSGEAFGAPTDAGWVPVSPARAAVETVELSEDDFREIFDEFLLDNDLYPMADRREL